MSSQKGENNILNVGEKLCVSSGMLICTVNGMRVELPAIKESYELIEKVMLKAQRPQMTITTSGKYIKNTISL